MYCMNCGKQVNDNAMNCPYCGGEIREENIYDNINGRNIVQKSKKGKRLTVIIILVLVVIAIFGIAGKVYDRTDAGKITNARRYMHDGNYLSARGALSDTHSEKAGVYWDYVELMLDVEYLCKSANNVYNIDNTIIEMNSRINNEIMPKKKGFLKESEERKLADVLSALEKYGLNEYKASDMRICLSASCGVYSQIDSFGKVISFTPDKVKKDAEEWKRELDTARDLYKTVMSTDDMPYYIEVNDAIQTVQEEIDESIEEFGGTASVYYPDGFSYKANRCTSEDIQELEYNMKRKLIQSYFGEISYIDKAPQYVQPSMTPSLDAQ